MTATERPLMRDPNLYLIFGTTLFAVMGVASIAPAFPLMMEYFGLDKPHVGLLVSVFTVPGIVLAPFMGVLADRIGRKAILVPSLFLFGFAGFTCMFTHKFETLLLFRLLQGIGASSLGMLNVTIIGDLYEGNRRATAMGYNASALSLGTASYPAIGGSLAILGWNFPFVLPLLAIPFGIVLVYSLNNPEPKEKHKLRQYGKNVWRVINQRSVWGLLIMNILVFFLIYGAYITYLPSLLKDRLMANPFHIGITMSVMSLTTAATSSQIGRISKKYSSRNILLTGVSFYIIAMILLAKAISWMTIIPPLLIFGLGQGLFLPTAQTMLVGFAPLKERAAFMSLNSMVLRIGQTTGPLIMGVGFAFGGLSYVYYGGAIFAVVMFLIIQIMIKESKGDSKHQ
jgi:MFS transporter, ACDE family, multidrug resistance protein